QFWEINKAGGHPQTTDRKYPTPLSQQSYSIH
ncbi:unnamed protein product, partial [marine sediment metagenome]